MLGCVVDFANSNDINEPEFRNIHAHYDAFQTRALRLGVELPDSAEEYLSLKFLVDQITKVKEYIKLHKTESMTQLFYCGTAAGNFFRNLGMAKLIKSRFTEESQPGLLGSLVPQANKFLQNLIKHAKELGVDIGDRLEEDLSDMCDKYINSQVEQDLHSIRVRLKKKMCAPRSEISSPPPPQLDSTVYKRSEIDPTRVITDQCWTVSLVRLPDRSNPQHAFIVLEGTAGRKSKIWFPDFVAAHWFDAVRPGTEDGNVTRHSKSNVRKSSSIELNRTQSVD